ncbi:TPA: glycerol-3-phosphate ABC transporter substrate-binding protein, partial [Legionella pneumophila]|nr:glycerol-3-phosphate ABC transporter substrate-binding protein [Legionella pneumophila]
MKILFLLLLIFLSVIPAQAKPVELVFWHAMAGHLGDEVRLLADDFNKS